MCAQDPIAGLIGSRAGVQCRSLSQRKPSGIKYAPPRPMNQGVRFSTRRAAPAVAWSAWPRGSTLGRCSRLKARLCVNWRCRRCPRSRAATTCLPRSSTTRLSAPPMACLTRPPARCARSARSAGDWTCAAAPARACGSSAPCARDRSRASTSARACSRRRAVRTRTPAWVRADVRALPFAGAFDLAVSFGAVGHFLPAERPALFAGVHRALRPGGVFAFPIGRAAAHHLTLVLGTARVRPGHAGPQCRVASPVRHVLPHLPAARGPRRPDRIRIHRDDPSLDGSRPARGRQPAVPACPRAQSKHALTAAYANTTEHAQPGRSSGRLAASWPCSRPVDWPTSMRYPSGSRRTQRISAPRSIGGVTNSAPLAFHSW